MQLISGTLLQGGKYRIEKVLGQGGFGITYLAVQTNLKDRKVAIKEFFLKEHCERDSSTSHVSMGTSGSKDLVLRFKNKFVKEAETISEFRNHHVITIFDIFEENGTAYYVMEHLSCGSLAERIPSSGIPESEALSYIRQVCDALSYIHSKKILHLDIKPSNILFRRSDEAVLIDFGISKHYDEAGGSQTSSTPVGVSRGYAPLEQYKSGGVAQFTPATDIYSLGATLYKLLTGQAPPDADEVNEDGLPEFPSDVPQYLREAIIKSMQPKKKDRPQSVAEFLFLLEADDEGTVVPPPPPPSLSSTILRRSRFIAALVLIFLLMRMVIMYWEFMVFPDRSPKVEEETPCEDGIEIVSGKLYDDYSKIEIGDYFYSDGSYSRGVIDSLKPVGVVFSLEVSENDRKRGWTHGYIMALSDAKRGRCKWGPANDINEIPNYSDTENDMLTMMNDLNGYDYTCCSSLESTVNDSFYYARNYDASLPKSTSGWFLPSFGHWTCIVENLGKTNVYTKVVNKNSGLTRIYFNGSAALKNLVEYGFKDDDYSVYWSSCEGPKFEGWRQDAWIIGFNDNPENDIYSLVKETSRMSIRTVAAF